MKMISTATLKTGDVINCEWKKNEWNVLMPEYPVQYKSGIGWCIKLDKIQIKEILGKSAKNDHNYIKLDKQYKYDEKDQMVKDLLDIREPTIDELLKENPILTLIQFTHFNCSDGVSGLPKALEEKRDIIAKMSIYDWDITTERFQAKISFRELIKLLNEKEDQQKEIDDTVNSVVAGMEKNGGYIECDPVTETVIEKRDCSNLVPFIENEILLNMKTELGSKMKTNTTKLITDLKNYVSACNDPCEVCEYNQEVTGSTASCVGCEHENADFSEKLRTVKEGAGYRVLDWTEFAFVDVGADLLPADYGITEYYGDAISAAELALIEKEMEEFCETRKA